MARGIAFGEDKIVWRETTKHQRNLEIWRDEFEDFVPRRVLDFHVHVFDHATMRGRDVHSVAGHPIAKYDLEDLKQDLPEVYPGRDTFAVCFGSPSPRYDMAGNNSFVAANCDGKRFFPFRMVDPAEDPERIRADVIEQGFMGFKPYLDYVRKADRNDVEIVEMLPGSIMDIAEQLRLIVMLHIPRKRRLEDPVNQRQIVELCRNYPHAKIVLAHIGRAYYLANVTGNLESLRTLPNLYVDLAMLNNWEVLEHTFDRFPRERILYGTDVPIALAPGKSVEINNQYTYVTPVPWRLSISDDHGKLVFTSFIYEQLRAIKKAVDRLGLGKAFLESLFFDSGMKLLKSVPR